MVEVQNECISNTILYQEFLIDPLDNIMVSRHAEANPGRVTRVTRIGANASVQTTTRRNAKSNPGKITKVTRMGAKASGRTTNRHTSTYVT
eukprot:125723-Ditylum_brightwellii.AAC.1